MVLRNLKKVKKTINDKNYILSLLKWEMNIVAPKASLEELVSAMNTLECEIFDLLTSDSYFSILQNIIENNVFKDLSYPEQVHIKNLYSSAEKLRNVPLDFYAEYTREVNISQNVWGEAKKRNDYSLFKPHLEKLISLTKELYTHKYKSNENLYDKMLDDYEKGLTINTIDPLFEEIKNGLKPIIQNLPKENKKKHTGKIYDKLTLLELGKYLLNYIGYDNDRGILDFYPHGFTYKMSHNDVRIAFDQNRSIYDTVCTIIHEGGHGIFEQNISNKLEQYPGYHVSNMTTHESQSRFFENILGRNLNFWIPIYDDIKSILSLEETVEDFVQNLTIAHPSLIRTEADELTYCMHIIVRYEIEKMIFNENISLDILPEIWNQKMKDYLKVNVDSDAHGILQDVHWSRGKFGYFPSYLLGSIFDGMLLECVNNRLGNVDMLLKNGKIKEITNFLIRNIHSKGMTYNIFELSECLCGGKLSPQPLINYFRNKYMKN